jgi:hypothetical protein
MTQIELYLKCFGEVLARWCFEPRPVYGTKVVLKPICWTTVFSQNPTKTLQIKPNLSHLHCIFPFSASISHSMVSLVPYSQNNPEMSSDIFRFYDHIITCFLAGNSSYSLAYMFEAPRRIPMTLWHTEWGEHHYSTWSPQIMGYGCLWCHLCTFLVYIHRKDPKDVCWYISHPREAHNGRKCNFLIWPKCDALNDNNIIHRFQGAPIA